MAKFNDGHDDYDDFDGIPVTKPPKGGYDAIASIVNDSIRETNRMVPPMMDVSQEPLIGVVNEQPDDDMITQKASTKRSKKVKKKVKKKKFKGGGAYVEEEVLI